MKTSPVYLQESFHSIKTCPQTKASEMHQQKLKSSWTSSQSKLPCAKTFINLLKQRSKKARSWTRNRNDYSRRRERVILGTDLEYLRDRRGTGLRRLRSDS